MNNEHDKILFLGTRDVMALLAQYIRKMMPKKRENNATFKRDELHYNSTLFRDKN